MKRLGERIRRKRESMHMQLNDLAKRVGISASAMSQIENAKAFPTLLNLKAIADSLNTTVGEIIGEYETLSQNPRIKTEEKKFVKQNENGASLFLLSHHDPHKQMETYYMIFEEGSDAEGLMLIHPGQEFIHVINGSLLIELDKREYILESGDSFYFNSGIPHNMRNINKGKSEVIWVITPPNF